MSNLFNRLMNAVSNVRTPPAMRPEMAALHRREQEQRLQRPVSMVWLLLLLIVVVIVVVLVVADAARAVELSYQR